MTTLESLTLGAHVVAGFLALFAGLGAILTTKGGDRHRRFGRVYVYAMAFVSASVLVLLAFEQSFARQFLTLVAVFSFYFAFSGYRVLSRKRPSDDPALVDWVALGLTGVASVGLLGFGGLVLLNGGEFAPVILVFGAVGTVFAAQDLSKFRRDPDRGEWVAEHLTRMGAGYIATVSAFSAVNFVFLPTAARWLWPTLLGTPLLFYFAGQYREKFAPTTAA